jgi:DNA polymerase-3 subunit alpha
MHHPVCGMEHAHKHSDFSLLDGLGQVSEYAQRSKEINQRFLCITDHGVMGAVPQQISESEEHGLFPIFGCEMYINRMQFKAACREESSNFRSELDEDQKKKWDKNRHLLALAYNSTGYRNLVQLTSWAWIHGCSGRPTRPRINWEMLLAHKEGLIITSTCANSEIAAAFFEGGDDAGFDMVEQYMAAFGDKFYLELMMLDFKDQKPYDQFLIRAHNKYGVPVFLSQDCHYCRKENSHHQRLMLMMKTDRTIQEVQALIASGDAEDLFELQDENLWLKSEDELNEKWEKDYQNIIDYDLFMIAKQNAVKICELCKGVELDRTIKLPIINDDKQKLMEAVKRGVVERRIPRTKQYLDRIMEEYSLICEKGFASYFIIMKMMVEEGVMKCPELYGWDQEFGWFARGPGRGSVCGSLVAYCLDLHDVEPIRHGLLFSRFLSPARGGKQMKIRFTVDPMKLLAS